MSEKDNTEESKTAEDGSSEQAGGADASGGIKYDEMKPDAAALPEEKEWEMGEAMANDVTAIYDIPVQISAVLGRSSMQVSQLLKLLSLIHI